MEGYPRSLSLLHPQFFYGSFKEDVYFPPQMLPDSLEEREAIFRSQMPNFHGNEFQTRQPGLLIERLRFIL